MRKLYAVLAICFFAGGLFILLKPTINNIMATQTEVSEVERFKTYRKELMLREGLPEGDNMRDFEFLPALRAACEAYNTDLFETGNQAYENSFSLNPADYGWTDPVFGILNIPALGDELPLYLGTNNTNLMLGVGVLGQTSVPIGGINTHSVILGHRTWRGDDKLLDIDKLVIGDDVYVMNLWETLQYKVVDIQIINPTDYGPLALQPGRDLISIFTCHPANVASHRYVVTCERVE